MAKEVYKGHEINVTREPCNAGHELLYYSILRVSDGYECDTDFQDCSETVEEFMQILKDRVDAELKEVDPWEEKAAERRFLSGL